MQEISTHSSGLWLASETCAGAQTAAFAITVGVGARYETSAQHGISHLLEHMAFKGTRTHNAQQLAEAFDSMGGHVNAYTSSETTVYYVKVLKSYATQALDLLCSIVCDSLIDASELERERGVILQELAMHHDTPDDCVFDQLQETSFPAQALGRSILGTQESIQRHTREDILAYIAQHYMPHRMVLSAAGAVDHAMLTDAASRWFTAATSQACLAPEPAYYQGGISMVERALEQVQCCLCYPAFALSDDDYYALQVFSTLLGGGMSSRLFQEIREKRGLAYSVSAFASCYQDTGVLGIYAATSADAMGELLPALGELLHHSTDDITPAELLRAKNQLTSGIVMARESYGSIAEWMGRHLLLFGRVKSAEEIADTINAISADAIQRVANRTLFGGALTLATLGPIASVDYSALPTRRTA